MFILKCILTLGFIGVLFIALNILFPLIEFDGESMYPTYSDGELVRGSRIFNKNFKVGHVYVFTREKDGETYNVIKRLSKIKMVNDEVLLFFEGDNVEESIDSRFYGYVEANRVIAKVIKPRIKEEIFNETNECA